MVQRRVGLILNILPLSFALKMPTSFDFILHQSWAPIRVPIALWIMCTFWFCWRITGCQECFKRPDVAVNHENDTYFWKRTCYAECKCLAGLVETSKVVSIVSLALCQTHCKQVPDFSTHVQYFLPILLVPQIDKHQVLDIPWLFPPTCGSIWVVLWLLFFRSASSMFP